MEAHSIEEDQLSAIAFVGNTLAPFFLQDPTKGNAGALFESFAELDICEAAAEWPFVSHEESRQCLSLMSEALHQGITEEIVWEYRRLFIGPGIKPAPPWGSVYTDRDGVVFGLSTLELRAWMRSCGLSRIEDDSKPEDHIGLMLALMAYLAQERPCFLVEFLQEHLLTWSGHFLNKLSAAANNPFYEGLARLTNASLEGIRRECALEVVYPRFYR